MLLSLLLDFFKCRKSILGQPALNSPSPAATTAQLPLPPTAAATPTSPATMCQTPASNTDETSIDLPVGMGADYDSVLNLELELDDDLGYDDPRLPELII